MRGRCTSILAALVVLAVLMPCRAEPQSYLGKSVGEWQRQLAAKDAKARRDAAFALGKLGPEAEDAGADLLKLLKGDADKNVRETAAYALGQVSKRGRASAEAIDALCQIVAGTGDALVKRSSAVALGSCATDTGAVRQALAKALHDKHPGVRQNAAWALGEICKGSDQLPLADLRKGLQDADPLVKRDAALAMTKILSHQTTGEDSEAAERQRLAKVREKGEKAIPDLLECAGHDYLELRKAALGTLTKLSLEDYKAKAALLLARVCKKADEDLEVRYNAALSLANIGGEEATPAVAVLRDAFKTGDIETKRLVALSYRHLGPTAIPALDDLCQALKHQDAELRLNAAHGLGGLKAEGHKAVPHLVKVVVNGKEDSKVRVAAAMSLQSIGACDQATEAIPELVKVLDDPKQPVKVRERVLWALRVHRLGLRDDDRVIAVLKKILTEPGLGTKTDAGGGSSGKMLRYDSAFLLSVFKRQDAPDEVLEVLSTFLHDSSIRIYTGINTTGGGIKGEGGGTDKGMTAEKTGKDGRIMALDALGLVGNDRVKGRPEILQQLRAMSAENSNFEPEIQEAARKLAKELGGK